MECATVLISPRVTKLRLALERPHWALTRISRYGVGNVPPASIISHNM